MLNHLSCHLCLQIKPFCMERLNVLALKDGMYGGYSVEGLSETQDRFVFSCKTYFSSECKSLNSQRVSVNMSVFCGKYRECRRSFRFTSVLGGTPGLFV